MHGARPDFACVQCVRLLSTPAVLLESEKAGHSHFNFLFYIKLFCNVLLALTKSGIFELSFHPRCSSICLISGLSKAHFGSFEGLHQYGYYFREHLYCQTSLKAWDSEEKPVFSSRMPLSYHIAWLTTYPIAPCILTSLYATAHHPYTTLATGKWMIFWPSEDSPFWSQVHWV